uniref:Remorin C-terminal domain-containing protein n=1 Tax=Setaria italica TaxID=4555 RepID=K3YGR4_SETIT
MMVGDGGGRGGGGGGGEGAVVSGRRGAVEEEGEGEASGCSASASSTSRGSSARGSSGGDSPLTRFVRRGGRLGTGPEPDERLTSSSSYGSTEPHDEEDDGSLQGGKDNRWVRARLQGQAKNAVPRPTGECQDQRHRLGAVLFQGRKDRAQRPASVDFGCSGVAKSSTHSPGFPVNGVRVMNKGLGVSYSSYSRPDVLSSPGTPSYHRRGTTIVGYQQGPNSERVIPPSARHRRHPGSSMVLPYSSGRTLPSKWEDAERWIFSPNPSNALGRSVPQLWRPKSKSGPLGPTGRFGGPYSSSSSSALFLESGRVGNLTVNSPYLAGVLLPEHVCAGVMDSGRDLSGASGEDSSNGRGGRSGQTNGRYPAMQSTRASQQFGSATESYQSLPTSHESIHDGQIESIKDSAASSTPVIVRKDVATQTSPDISRSSSSNMRSSFSRSLSAQQVKELESCFSKLEIRDVQVDDRVTLTRWSKKHVTRGFDKNATNIIEWKKKTMESKSSAWEVKETAKCISKMEGEEAKMTAWENMQKANAEAAIQKLVIKLEKKRPYSLERIFSTLRSGPRKMQVLRSTSTANHDQHISRTIKTAPHLSKNGQMSSLSGCFTCHAF